MDNLAFYLLKYELPASAPNYSYLTAKVLLYRKVSSFKPYRDDEELFLKLLFIYDSMITEKEISNPEALYYEIISLEDTEPGLYEDIKDGIVDLSEIQDDYPQLFALYNEVPYNQDVLLEILLNVKGNDLISFCKVNKNTMKVCNSKRLFELKFPEVKVADIWGRSPNYYKLLQEHERIASKDVATLLENEAYESLLMLVQTSQDIDIGMEVLRLILRDLIVHVVGRERRSSLYYSKVFHFLQELLDSKNKKMIYSKNAEVYKEVVDRTNLNFYFKSDLITSEDYNEVSKIYNMIQEVYDERI